MDSDKRREKILETIKNSDQPLTGSQLSSMFGVSRQVIVQDIAILRASGFEIIATPQGYMTIKYPGSNQQRRVIACKHYQDRMEEELITIVDLGGKILDVTVDHPVYGEFKGQLMIQSPSDVRSFVNKMEKEEAEPLSSLTEGVHLHTVEGDTKQILDRIEAALKEKGLLVQ